MFNADIDLKMAAIKQQLAASQAMSEKLNQPGGLSYKDVSKMNQDLQDKMVQLPNGNYMPARNKEAANEVSKKQVLYYPILDLTKQFYKAMEQGPTLPKTEASKNAKRLEASMLVELKNLSELGALTKDDMKIIDPLVPQIGNIIDPAAQKQAVDFIVNRVNSRLNAVYSAYIPGLNPSGRATREKSVFGRP
jgi:hypothetical protein